MRLISRLTKGWSEPPFWSTERLSMSNALLSSNWGTVETVPVDFERYVEEAYKTSGVVFACIAARAMVFSQARFLWRRMSHGRPSDLFGDQELTLIEKPWTNGSTTDLLVRMEQDVSLAGNSYELRLKDARGLRMQRLRPDRVTIVTASASGDPNGYDSYILAYMYKSPGSEPVTFDPADIVHYVEFPDPVARHRGMSWLTPVIREIQADKQATEHKLAYFRHGAKPSVAITYDASIDEPTFQAFVKAFEQQHQSGAKSAYKALHLGGGADVTPLSTNLKDLDFKGTQGAGEGRIAAASGAHPVIVPLAEGMQGSSLNAGNFQAARRLFVDGRIRFLWSKAAPALGSVLKAPEGAHLWYDDRDIAFLRQDAQEEAEILSTQATAIKTLLEAGFNADEAVLAVTTGDLRRLGGQHSGLFSVQLQPRSTNPPSGGDDR